MIKPDVNYSMIASYCKKYVKDIEAVYVFGSQVAGYAHKDSDVDIAILCAGSFSEDVSWELSQGLAIVLNKDVDIVDLRQASTVMQWQIIRTGERIFCADEKQISFFETYVFSDYVRLNELRLDLLQDIKQRGSIYGG